VGPPAEAITSGAADGWRETALVTVWDLGGALSALSVFSSFEGVAEWAAEWGLPAVALVVAGDGLVPILPGETAIVAAAVLASAGDLSLTLVILAGAIGAMAGDWTAYWIGRAGGGPITRVASRLAGAERIAAAEAMVERHGAALVFVGRFLPGLRIGVNLACGAGGMAFRRFALFNSLGAAVWSTQAALLGFFVGKAFAGQLWVAILVAVAVTLAVGAGIAWRERVRVRRERERAAAEAPPAGTDDGRLLLASERAREA
jgi:membrane-associated protein